MIIQRYVDVYSGMYDFNTSGGAIGHYNLNIPIPMNCVVECGAIAFVSAAGGAGATISFDVILTSIFPNVSVIGALIAATEANGFSQNIPVIGTYFGGTGANAPYYNPLYSISVGMSIGVAALAQGKIKFFARVIGFDF